MENPEEILHSLEEFAKMKPKDIPRELEEYLKFVAKTGDPIYQWSVIKSLFREKLINVINEFYESCAGTEIPPCPNVEVFNYDLMKSFILEKLDTFVSAPFTLQRICELLTSPRKEYTRVDKYMRALEKNILVVSTIEPGGRRTENGEGIMNGVESDHEHVPEPANEINVEEMDETPYVPTNNHLSECISLENTKNGTRLEVENTVVDAYANEELVTEGSASEQELVCVQYVSIEPVLGNNADVVGDETKLEEDKVSVTITAISVTEEVKPTVTPQEEDVIKHTSQESSEKIDETANDQDSPMDTDEVTQSTLPEKTLEVTSTPQISEAILSSTAVSEKTLEEALVSQTTDNLSETETVSPESSISSSENSNTEFPESSSNSNTQEEKLSSTEETVDSTGEDNLEESSNEAAVVSEDNEQTIPSTEGEEKIEQASQVTDINEGANDESTNDEAPTKGESPLKNVI